MSKKHADRDPPSGPRPSRARPGKSRRSRTASVRVDLETLARIDAIAAARSTPERTVTRAEAVRDLIATGLPLSEEKAVSARRAKIAVVKEPSSREPEE
jgi:predicted transcriptional regulator